MATVSERIELRPVTPDDVDFLYRVYASTRQQEVAAFGWSESAEKAFLKMQFEARQAAYKMQFPGASQEIVLYNAEPVGQMIVDHRPEALLLVDISILRKFRGMGIGSQLIGILKGEADANDIPLRLHVDRTNFSAFEWYKKLGFQPTAETDLMYEMEWRARG